MLEVLSFYYSNIFIFDSQIYFYIDDNLSIPCFTVYLYLLLPIKCQVTVTSTLHLAAIRSFISMLSHVFFLASICFISSILKAFETVHTCIQTQC